MVVKKRLKKKLLLLLYGEDREFVGWFSLTEIFQAVISQKILRYNSHVPWPVHISSVVTSVEKIKFTGRTITPLGFSNGCYIQSINGIEIGENVWIGPGVKIISANHNIDNLQTPVHDAPIIIGDNCWIGANAVILPGVVLGMSTVVGAGAIVTKSFPNGGVIVGNPAKRIK